MFSMQTASAASGRRSTVAGRASRISMVAAVAVAALASAAAHAQTNLKIGVINFARLMEQAPQAQAIMDKLKDEFAARQREIMALRQKLQNQSDTFTKDAPVMGEAERLNLEREIRDGQRDLQRAENEYVEDLNVRRNEEVGKLNREVIQLVQAYASAQKFDLVVTDAIYFSASVDITAAVLDALQKNAPAPRPGASAPPSAPRP